MGEFLSTLINVLNYAWPFREVEGWERGVYTVFGKPWKQVGAGRWPVVPYFMDVRAVSMVPAVVQTPLQFVTLASGTTASFSASAVVHVEDVQKAIFEVDDYRETTQELASAILAQELAEAKADRFETAIKRRNLMSELQAALDQQTSIYGVRVTALRFNNFSTNLRIYRLVQDSATLQTASW